MAERNKAWFIIAFDRLQKITAQPKSVGILFSGSLAKMKLKANCLGYGPCPEETDEVEQHLTITGDGRVFYTDYCYGDGTKYRKIEQKRYRIEEEKAKRLLLLLETYFSKRVEVGFTTDVGSWELVLTNTEGKNYTYWGSLYPMDALTCISDIYRNELGMPTLFMFDGQEALDKIESMKIQYHRVTKGKARQGYTTWDYTESIEIDRATQMLSHIRNLGSGCSIRQEYRIEEGISTLLDSLEEETSFSYVVGNGEDTVGNPLETKEYVIEITYQGAGKQVIRGTFDRDGLPSDFSIAAEMVQSFIEFYGLGEILDPVVYGKRLRKKDELIFCNVVFEEQGKTYCYLTEDESLKPGDVVIVPVGADHVEQVAKIESVEYHVAEEAPYPVEKIKHIIKGSHQER